MALTKYRCTACGVETMSSKMCPRCGRRSTLVPVDQRTNDAEGASSPSRSTAPSSSRNLVILVALVILTVAGSVTALLLSLRRPHHEASNQAQATADRTVQTSVPSAKTSSSSGPVASNPPGPHIQQAQPTRPTPPIGPICGRQYCLVMELSMGPAAASTQPTKAQSAKERKAERRGNTTAHASEKARPNRATSQPRGPEGRLVTKHCFITEQAPSAGRYWYVPVSHQVTWQPAGKSHPVTLLALTKDQVTVDPKASQILGLWTRSVDQAHNPIGRRLFYLTGTPYGFAPASPPSLSNPVDLQMAIMALSASALIPKPPRDTAGAPKPEWLDRRPLALPMKSPDRLWKRTSPRGAKLLRWTMVTAPRPGSNEPAAKGSRHSRPSQTSQPSKNQHKRVPVRIRGTAEVLAGHLTKSVLSWKAGHASGRLLLLRQDHKCL